MKNQLKATAILAVLAASGLLLSACKSGAPKPTNVSSTTVASVQPPISYSELEQLRTAPSSGTASTANNPAITGTTWILTELNGEAASTTGGNVPDIYFDTKETRAFGSTSVNRFNGAYVLSSSNLSFGPAISTRMAGPDDAMKLEFKFLSMLETVDAWRITDGKLEFLKVGTVVARFKVKAI